jgi:type I restriction enzyme S subunit
VIKKIYTEDFPDSWELVPLGEFVENEKGKKPRRESKEKTTEFNLPYIDIAAFEEGFIKSWTDGDGCRMCYEDDFLMVWDGSRSGLVGKGMRGALGSTLVRINFPSIINDYAFYFLKSKFAEINSRAKGVGIPHVDPNLLWNYEFPIPPINEQRRIVAKIEELFSELGKGIESLKTAREQLKIYRQAVLKHAFEGKLTADWREKNKDKLESADQLLASIKKERELHYQQQLKEWSLSIKDWEVKGKITDAPIKPRRTKELNSLTDEELKKLPNLPDGWIWQKLGELAAKITDGEHFRPPVQQSGIYFLSAKDVRDDGVSFDDPLYISEQTAQKAHLRCNPQRGDLLIVSRGATVGRMCIVNTDKIFCLLGSVILIKVISGIDSVFLSFALKSPFISRKIISISGATAQQAIYLRDIQHIPTPFCSLAEQQEIARVLEQKLSIITEIEKIIEFELQRSEALRQSILKKAFSGQLVAQDPKDEPASVLLERIRAEKSASKLTTKKPKEKKRAV